MNIGPPVLRVLLSFLTSVSSAVFRDPDVRLPWNSGVPGHLEAFLFPPTLSYLLQVFLLSGPHLTFFSPPPILSSL